MGLKQLIVAGRILLLIVIAVTLQTLVVSQVSVLGVTADLFLIFTVAVAISKGAVHGAIFGFIAGAVADIAFMQTLGLRSLIYVLTGYSAGVLVQRMGTVNPWSVLILAGSASFGAQFLYGLAQYAMGPQGGFITMLGTQILPETVLDALVAVPVYLLLMKLQVLPAPRPDSGTARSGGQ